ncbi:MAG: hypothetical protein ACYDBB_23500 [Armatimonadota bacterium]
MLTSVYRLRWILLCCLLSCALSVCAQGGRLLWEAEELVKGVKIVGGGDLLVIRAPDPERLRFSGDRALTFVPRGKGSAVDFKVTVPTAGVYTLRLTAVMGPSCGIYNVFVNGGDTKAWLNFYNKKTIHSSKHQSVAYGFNSKRAEFKAGENTVEFQYESTQGRMGNLVLDTVEVIPFVRKKPNYAYTAFEKELPAGEKLGVNLLKNAGFEEFLPTDRFQQRYQNVKGWQFNSVIPKNVETIVRDPALAHAGNLAICLAPDPLEENTVIYQTVPTQSGKRYRVTFYARGKGDIQVMFYQTAPAKAEDTLNGNCIFPATDKWQLYTYLFEPSRSAKLNSASLALYALAESEVYFDDVSVQEVQ